MSKEQAIAFGKKVNGDTSLKEEIRGMGRDIDAIVAVGAREGYSFTKDDLQAAVKDRMEAEGAEISEADLEQIAGGTGITTPY